MQFEVNYEIEIPGEDMEWLRMSVISRLKDKMRSNKIQGVLEANDVNCQLLSRLLEKELVGYALVQGSNASSDMPYTIYLMECSEELQTIVKESFDSRTYVGNALAI
ncbi:hypothetical protein DITRI_Ditri02bG0139600 [Diplodiscus trichospermus]